MMTLRHCLRILTLAVLAASAGAQPYPSRPIRLIVPSAPGSPPDVVARILAERLTARLAQPVVVDNRPGAIGTIGLSTVAKATPDGYTLGMIALPFVVAPSLISRMPYDIVRDLAPIGLAVWSSNMLVVRSESPWHSLSDLIAAAKSRPGQVTFASGGNATPAHLAGESFKRRAGIELTHVPFKGTVPGVTAVLGEQVDMMFATTGVVAGHLKSGRLRALAAMSPSRLSAYPDVPTMSELRFAQFDVRDWNGVVAPAATPKVIVTKLAGEMRHVIADPRVSERMVAVLFEPAYDSSPEQFGLLIRSELEKWGKVVREAGLRAE
jgi:tripartite-type tricarboxylate transporter receptor subunit TctC